MISNGFSRLIRPHAILAPLLPVTRLNGWLPKPPSSSPSCNTIVRSSTEFSPINVTLLSIIFIEIEPSLFTFKFPKSPLCLVNAIKNPCVSFVGLKCGPALPHT